MNGSLKNHNLIIFPSNELLTDANGSLSDLNSKSA